MTTPNRSAGPLASTQERLRAVRPDLPDAYAVRVGVPAGTGWLGVDALLAGGVGPWWVESTRRGGSTGRASVAAVRVIGSLAHAVLGRLTAALVLDRRAHDVRADNLAVHRDADGHIDRVAARRPDVTVLPDDEAADAPGVVVAPDLPALLDTSARQAVGVLGPVIDELRALSRFGVVPAWNVVADSVLSTATFVPLFASADERAGRAVGEALLDALVSHGARIGTRGTCTTVRKLSFPVRGSCCFHYRTAPKVEAVGDEFCTTCPLLDARIRSRRFEAFLDEYVLPRRHDGPAVRSPR